MEEIHDEGRRDMGVVTYMMGERKHDGRIRDIMGGEDMMRKREHNGGKGHDGREGA